MNNGQIGGKDQRWEIKDHVGIKDHKMLLIGWLITCCCPGDAEQKEEDDHAVKSRKKAHCVEEKRMG